MAYDGTCTDGTVHLDAREEGTKLYVKGDRGIS